MANAYSQLVQYNAPHNPVNLALDAAVLGSLQKSYDANVAKVDAVIEAYGNIPLLRQKDKEQLANNINTMMTQVNTFSKMDLTNSDSVRQIQQSMKSALTPELMKQAEYAVKLNSFNDTVAKKRDKGDGTYSDANYQYSLDQANYESYMKGETNTLGELRYYDFIDEGKVIRDEINRWGKNYGVDVTYREGSTGIDGVVLKQKGEALSEQRVRQIVDNIVSTNPNLQQQMRINAHTSFRGLDEEGFRSMYANTVEDMEKNYNNTKSEIKVLQSNYAEDSEEYKAYDAQLQNIDARINNYKAPLNGGAYNRKNLELQLYSDRTLDSYAKSYAYERWEAPSYDKTLWEVNRAIQKDQEKRNKELGLDNNGNPLPSGTPFTEDVVPPETLPTTYGQITAEYDEKFKALDAKVAGIYGEEYSSKNITDRLKFVRTLQDVGSNYNINESPLSADMMEDIASFSQQYDKIVNYKTEVKKQLQPIVVEAYNNMVNGIAGIDLNNLSYSLPNTSQILRTGKSFESLSKDEQNIVTAEIAKANRDRMASSSKEDFEDWDVVYKDYLRKAPEVNKEIIQNTDEQYGFWEGNGRVILSGFGSLANSFSSRLGTFTTLLRQGTEAAESYQLRNQLEQVEELKKRDDIRNRTYDPVSSFFSNDRYIDNLQANDWSQDKSYTSFYNEKMANARTALQPFKDTQSAQNSVVQGISYNPKAKQDKPMVSVLDSQARANKITPDSEGLYSVSLQDGNYVVSVTDKKVTTDAKGKRITTMTPVTFKIPENQAPKQLRDKLRSSTGSTDFQKMGFQYTIPKSLEEKAKTITKFSNAFGSKAPSQALDKMYQGQAFRTTEEIIAPYRNRIRTVPQQEAVNQMLTANYSLKPLKMPSGVYVAELYMNGQPTGIDSSLITPNGISNPTSYNFAFMTSSLTEAFIQSQLNNIR